MLNDYFFIRGKNVDESRFQRTIETFRKDRIDVDKLKEAEQLDSL
jgi:hypothetical protein